MTRPTILKSAAMALSLAAGLVAADGALLAGAAHATAPAPIVSGTGLCLDAHPDTARKKRGKVRARSCNGNWNQTWRWGAVKKEIKIRNNNGLCLDASRSKATTNGGKVMLWPCHGGKNQKWLFKQGRLQNGMGLCLDIDKSNQGVRLWNCNKGANQRWGRDRQFGLLQMFEPSQTQCGGLNQRVCRKNEQIKGCDPGFHRSQVINGTCTRDNKWLPDALETGDLKDKAREIASSMTTHIRVMNDIVQCLRSSDMNAYRQAIERRDQNAALAIIFTCVSPEQVRLLSMPPWQHAANAVGFRSISIGIGASSMFGVGLGGEAGLVLSLDKTAMPRFYTAGGMKFGWGAGVSGDFVVGISTDDVTPGKSNGTGIVTGAKALAGASVGVFFANEDGGGQAFNAFSVSAGGGGGFEAGTANPTWSRIW